MSREHYVIIGNGPAANTAAMTLREGASKARITMISRERVGFYRPHLLPDFVAGKLSEKDLYVSPNSFYKERGIKLRLGQEVKNVDFSRRELTLDHKELVPFDGLVIAVGGRPRIPEPLQVHSDVMLTLKTVDEARAWKTALSRADSVVIVGGDLTSVSVAKALLSVGKQVTFLLDADSFWPLHLTSSAREEVVANLKSQGLGVLNCKKLKDITRISERVVEARTDAGSLRAGVIGAFFGLTPDVKFLMQSGIDIERGILVDEHLKTPFEGAYAAGDCAQVYHPELRDYWVSVGYKNAKNLGKIAALNLMGAKIQADAAQENIFQFEGITVRTPWWTEF